MIEVLGALISLGDGRLQQDGEVIALGRLVQTAEWVHASKQKYCTLGWWVYARICTPCVLGEGKVTQRNMALFSSSISSHTTHNCSHTKSSAERGSADSSTVSSKIR